MTIGSFRHTPSLRESKSRHLELVVGGDGRTAACPLTFGVKAAVHSGRGRYFTPAAPVSGFSLRVFYIQMIREQVL